MSETLDVVGFFSRSVTGIKSRSALHFGAMLVIVGMSAVDLLQSGHSSNQEWKATRDLSLYSSIGRELSSVEWLDAPHDRILERLSDQGAHLSSASDPVRTKLESAKRELDSKEHSREDWNAFVESLVITVSEAERTKLEELGALRDARSFYEFWSAIVLAGILLGESFFVFFPLLRRTAKTLEEMAETSEELFARNAEVQTARAQLELQNHDLELQRDNLERINLEQKTSLQLLQMASARFQELFHGVPFACFSINEEMQIFEWNQKCVEIFGRQGFEVFEQFAPDALGGAEESEYLQTCFRQILEGNPTDSVPIKFKQTSGEPLEALLSGFTIRGATGEVSGAIIALVDVTERQQAERALNRYKHLVQQSSSGILVTSLEGEILIANESARSTLLLETGDTLFTGVLNHLTSEEDLEAILHSLSEYSETKFTVGYQTPYGTIKVLDTVVSTIRDCELNPQNYLLMIQDVTENALRSKELAAQQQLFSAGMSAMPVGVVLLNAEREVQYFNSPAGDLFIPAGIDFGKNLPEILRSSLRLPNGDALEEGMCPCELAIRTGQPITDFELLYQCGENETRHLSVNSAPLFFEEGGPCTGVIASILDITAAKKMEDLLTAHMNHLDSLNFLLESQKEDLESANRELDLVAKTDGLTGLLNARELRRLLEVNRDPSLPLAVIMLDIDHFKQFNDTFGHPGGDEVLRAVSKCLQYATDESAIVGRYGGEEFMVMLVGPAAQTAPQVAEEIRSAIQDFPWEMRPITASIGVAQSEMCVGSTSYELVELADKALYVSKESGRNRVTLHRPELKRTA